MTVILTDYDRKVWKESAEDIIKYPDRWKGGIPWATLARHRLRYEKTLVQKDAQIAALVTALKIAEFSGVREWGIPGRCPKCFITRNHQHRADCEIGMAIKEATDGS